MSFRNVAVPWLGGGLIVLGYAALRRLRVKRGPDHLAGKNARQQEAKTEPLSARLEHVPEEVALDLESEPLPANSNALSRSADLGALFLGRASEALSPFHLGPEWPQVRR